MSPDNSAKDAPCLVGFGKAIISPPRGVDLAGYFTPRPNRGVLDELHARAWLIQSGHTVTGVVNFDLLCVTSELDERVRLSLQGDGFPSAENLILCATHTHTGPALGDSFGYEGSPDVLDYIVKKSVMAVRSARENLYPAAVYAGSVRDNPFAFNRRYWMKDGSVATNPGKLNPEIVKPEGVVDREIGILAVRHEDEITGLVVNIVNHTDTVGGDRVSADWPGFMEREIQARIGAQVPILTLIGASGDINHIDVGSGEPQTSYGESRRIGTGYAEIVLDALPALAEIDGAGVRVDTVGATLRKRSVSDRELAEAEALLGGGEEPGRDPLTSFDLAKGSSAVRAMFARQLIRFAESEAGKAYEYRLTCIKFGGDLAIVSMPGEPFTEIGLKVKEGSPFRTTFVVSHANGRCGYVPLRECFPRGGYEVLPTVTGGVAEDTADVLVARAAAALMG